MALVPDVRINWRNQFSTVTNCSFLVDTSGWSVGASINAAATSITRVTGDGVLGGVTTNTCASLVTTGTSGSGANFDLPGTFTSGRTGRFSVWLKSVSGTTSAKILLGSLGTPADRASATMTLTTTWTRYSVDWTPSADRGDVELNVTNNAAAVMTARICLADVFEAIDDIGAYGSNLVDGLAFGRGASFDGSSEAPGSATLSVNDIDGRFDIDNAAGPLFGLLGTEREVYVRTVDTSAALVYGAFYGTIRRLVPRPWERKAEILCEDPLFRFGRTEVSLGASVTRSIRDFRIAILAAMNEPVVSQDLAYGPESDIGYTGSDARLALGVLDDLNVATGSIHYIKPHPSPDILYQYKTIDRTQFQTWTSAEHLDDTVAGPSGITDLSDYDVNDEALVTRQRVTPTLRQADTGTTVLWLSGSVPFPIFTGQTRLGLYQEGPSVDQVLTYDWDHSLTDPTLTLTPYATAGLITSGLGGIVTFLQVTGRILREVAGESVTAGSGSFAGAVITSEFIPSLSHAQGLADWIVFRYGTVKPRPGITLENRTATHTLRDIGQIVTLTFGRLSIVAKAYIIRALATTVSDNALEWKTVLALEEAPASNPLLFTLDVAGKGLNDAGAGTEGVLAV